jgi:hypothetical protein
VPQRKSRRPADERSPLADKLRENHLESLAFSQRHRTFVA